MDPRTIAAPPGLGPGSRIAVVAPGSPAPRAAVRDGFAVLRGWGFEPVPGPSLFARRGDLAGEDEARAADLVWAFEDPTIAAVWAARGGWGTARLLELLDIDRLLRSPRWLVGFSDLTALQLVFVDCGLATLQAPVVAELGRRSRYVARDVLDALCAPRSPRVFDVNRRGRLAPGRAQGVLTGGCLSLVAALTGTPWQPDFRGRVVFLEDVGEPPHRIDRMLWQLQAAGVLRDVAGLVFGQFVNCRPAPGRPARSLRAIFEEHSRRLDVPALAGIPAGHGARSRALPMGYTARLDAGQGRLELRAPVGAAR